MTDEFVKTRLATFSDAKALARLHYQCAKDQPDGFMSKLGIRFFERYYHVVLAQRSAQVLCAEDPIRGLVGLISGSAKAEMHVSGLMQSRTSLLLAALPSLVRHPALARPLIARYRSLVWNDEAYTLNRGPRIDYWCWKSCKGTTSGSLKLLRDFLHLMSLAGCREIQLEVDTTNRKVIVAHRFLGARVLKEFTTGDGRKRLVMKYTLPTLEKPGG